MMIKPLKNTKKKIFSSYQIGDCMNYDHMPNLYQEIVKYYSDISAAKNYNAKWISIPGNTVSHTVKYAQSTDHSV